MATGGDSASSKSGDGSAQSTAKPDRSSWGKQEQSSGPSAFESTSPSKSSGSKARSRKSSSKSRSSKKPKAEVTLRGRHEPGQRIRLYKVSGPEQLAVNAGDELVCVKRVGEDGSVTFTDADGVKVGQRYMTVSHVAGFPRYARVVGREPGDSAGGQAQPPVGVDQVRHGDGVIAGERGQLKAPAPPHSFLTGEGKTITVDEGK